MTKPPSAALRAKVFPEPVYLSWSEYDSSATVKGWGGSDLYSCRECGIGFQHKELDEAAVHSALHQAAQPQPSADSEALREARQIASDYATLSNDQQRLLEEIVHAWHQRPEGVERAIGRIEAFLEPAALAAQPQPSADSEALRLLRALVDGAFTGWDTNVEVMNEGRFVLHVETRLIDEARAFLAFIDAPEESDEALLAMAHADNQRKDWRAISTPLRPAPAALDVERLARAIAVARKQDGQRTSLPEWDRAFATAIAAEYERLGKERAK